MVGVNRLFTGILLSLYMIVFSTSLQAAPFEAYVTKNLYGKGLYNALTIVNRKTNSLDINNVAVVEHQLQKDSPYPYEDLLLMPFQTKKEYLEIPLMISLIKEPNNLALIEQRLEQEHGWDYHKTIVADLTDKIAVLGAAAARTPEPVKMVDEDTVKAIREDNAKELQELIRVKYGNQTFGDFYGPEVSEILKNSPCIKEKITDFPGLNHLLYPEAVKPETDGAERFRKIVGFHLDPEFRLLKANLYSLKNLMNGVGGMYVADLIYKKLVKVGKSFFPSTWSIAQLLEKISWVCHHPDVAERSTRNPNFVSVIGTLPEGFSVRITLNKDCGIFTAYPTAP